MHHYRSLKVARVNDLMDFCAIHGVYQLTHPGTLAISIKTNTQDWHKENGKYLSETCSGSCMSIAVAKTEFDKLANLQHVNSVTLAYHKHLLSYLLICKKHPQDPPSKNSMATTNQYE